MSVNIAFLADPHLCTISSRRNGLELFERGVRESIDTVKHADPLDRWSWRPGSFDKTPLLAAADFLTDLAPDLDLLVLLGDLATTGKPDDLEVARRVFLDNSTDKFATIGQEPRFGGKGLSMHVVPGNHDRYQDDFGTPGGTHFDEVFQSIYKPRSGVSAALIIKNGVTVSLISADFCHHPAATLNPIKRFGWGSVRSSVLNELEHRTVEAKIMHPDAPVIWALHFSPSENVNAKLLLEDRELVIEVANKHEVKHIFCGHTHLRTREIGTHPHIYSAGSVSASDSRHKHFLHICTVSKENDEHVLEVKDFIYDETEGVKEFVFHPLSDIA